MARAHATATAMAKRVFATATRDLVGRRVGRDEGVGHEDLQKKAPRLSRPGGA
jgi:hypothetical protein